MGLLQDGKWIDQWYDTKKNDGRFVRKESQFRNWITADGAAGPSGIKVSRLRWAAIIFMFLMHVPGRIEQ